MTSAIQLLYVLRSSSRRSQEPIDALESGDPDPAPDVRHRMRDRGRGRRGEDGDHSRRSHGGVSKGRHTQSCGSHVERELGRSTRNGSDGYWPGNGSNSNGGVSNSMLTSLGLTRNDQLPGAIEEARKRLLERLRSVSLTDNRRRAPSNHVLNDESDKNKIPALRWDAFCANKGEKYEGGSMAALTECCICLEAFRDGEWLLKLCCSHKFHPACLEPWVRSSGDCPLCRADIT